MSTESRFHYSKGGRRIYETERIEVDAPVHITRISLTYLRNFFIERKDRMITMGDLKGKAAADGDGFHDEVFQNLELQMQLETSRLARLLPGIDISQLAEDNLSSNVIIIEPNKETSIGLGSKVIAHEIDGEKPPQEEFILVGKADVIVNPSKDQRWISEYSPFGQALLGKKKGDSVVIKTPEGNITYEIDDVLPASELAEPLNDKRQAGNN